MIKLNPGQAKARALIKNRDTKFILLYGGSGGGKTFGALDTLLDRAAAAPGSYHLCLRSTAIDANNILFQKTFRDVLEAKFPTEDGSSTWEYLRKKGKLTLDPMMLTLDTIGPDGKPGKPARLRFAGLDDNKLDRILGADYASLLIDEVSLIDNFSVIDQLRTRLRQKLVNAAGNELRLKFIMCCNPPSKRHWTYTAFKQALNPNTGLPHTRPEQWAMLKVDGRDNAENLAEGYLEDLEEGSAINRQRFVEGDWYDDVDNPMFHSKDITECRLPPVDPKDIGEQGFTRIEVAVDPATTSKPGSDETGIMVVARDATNHGYVLADYSGKYQPPQWAKVVGDAYALWKADSVIAEINQGGEMVESNLRTYDRNIPVKVIHASRGKEIRAEGASTAYGQGRVHHCGKFDKLETQLLGFETGHDRRRKGSPDRLDALVHGLNSILLAPPAVRHGMKQQSFGSSFWRA